MQQNRSSSKPSKVRRVRALDGLRACAILAIMAYHLRLPQLPSGHLGVIVFLVLSGYLGTISIVRVFDQNGSVGASDLFRTWWHRVRRLWPSVAALVAIVGVLCAFLNHVLLTKMRPDALPALGFFENWAYIVRGTTYFDQIGGSSPLLHLWYLGVDLQFYLIWTFLLAILLKAGKKVTRRIALVLAIASAGWMVWLALHGANSGRMYYGTDTRAFSLLMGSWLAFAFPLGKVPVMGKRLLVRPYGEHKKKRNRQRYRATIPAHLMGLVSIAGLVALMVYIPSDLPLYFCGGLAGVTVLVVMLVATLLAPGSLVGRLLSFPPLAFLGTRAFSLYVWHYPIFLLFAADKTTTPWQLRLAAVGVAFVAAELSLHLFERAFEYRVPEEEKRPAPARLVVTSLLVVACGGYAAYALATIPDETLVPEEALVSTGAAADQAQQIQKPTTSTSRTDEKTESQTQKPTTGKDDGESTTGKTDSTSKETTSGQKDTESKDEKTQSKPVQITDSTAVLAPASETNSGVFDPVLIGDSVPGDAEWAGRLPNSLIDTYIGRRPDQALEVARGYLEQGVVGKVIVFACFSNTTPYPETLDAMIADAGADRQIFLVGTVNPDGFQDAANANLQDAAARYENVHYVDWPAVLEGHLEEYLWADATHLRPEGAVVYVDMITRAIAQSLVDAGGTTQ